MAAAAGGTPPALRLKDLLELDCDSCSAAGFRCYPRRLGESASAPMRNLLESSPSSLSVRRHRTSSKLSHLSRSLSRRLNLSRRGGGFWSSRRREDDEEDEDTAAAVAATAASSTGSGCCGSRSSSEEMETSSSSESSDNSCGRTSRRMSRSESDSEFSSATEDSVHHHPSHAAGAGDEHEVVVAMKRVVSKEGSSSGSEADDKEQEQEQLSPVAVMDFPFDDDDDEEELTDAAVACSPPSFSLERLQRRKTPHKIRRFGMSRDELAPLDLEARLADTSDPDDGPAVPPQPQQMMIQCRAEDAATPTCAGSSVHDAPHHDHHDLISLLMGTPVSAGLDDASERLLLDLFVEMMKRRRSEAELLLPLPEPSAAAAAGGVLLRRPKAEGVVDDGEEAAVAAAARDWLEGTGTERWGLTDVLSGGAAIVKEMERGRRWMQVGEEEREVGAMVAGMLLDQLVAEVVRSLLFV